LPDELLAISHSNENLKNNDKLVALSRKGTKCLEIYNETELFNSKWEGIGDDSSKPIAEEIALSFQDDVNITKFSDNGLYVVGCSYFDPSFGVYDIMFKKSFKSEKSHDSGVHNFAIESKMN